MSRQHKSQQFVFLHRELTIVIAFYSQLFHPMEKSTKTVLDNASLNKVLSKLHKHARMATACKPSMYEKCLNGMEAGIVISVRSNIPLLQIAHHVGLLYEMVGFLHLETDHRLPVNVV